MRSKMHLGQLETCQVALNSLNAEILTVQETLNLDRERKQMLNLKINPAAFFKYAKNAKIACPKLGH